MPNDHYINRLIYGTSGLHGGWSTKSSLNLLAAAYDIGIRHFDTSPMYGLGGAEIVIGNFLQGRSINCTITTKFGIEPPRYASSLNVIRATLKPIVARSVVVKRLLLRALSNASKSAKSVNHSLGLTSPGRFSVNVMTTSLDRSLKALGVGEIDIFLLHEGTVSDLTDELILALEKQVQAGKIKKWGLSGDGLFHSLRVDPSSGFSVIQSNYLDDFGDALCSDELERYAYGVQSYMNRRNSDDLAGRGIDRHKFETANVPYLNCLRDVLNSRKVSKVLFTSKDISHIQSIASL